MATRCKRFATTARRLALCVAGCLAWSSGALAASPELASPEQAGPIYNPLPYNDDFTYLANPAAATDFWDPIKYVPLGDGPYGPSYLTFGGQVRERFESYLNPNFGIHAPPSNAYLLQRLLLDADAHLTNYVRIFLQLGSFERLGDRGVPSTTDIDYLAVTQAFIDLKPPGLLGDAPFLRAGREELLFGDQRLIAVRSGPNIRRDFDGFRLHDQAGGVTVDLLDVHPVNTYPDVLADRTNYQQSLSGAYVTLPIAGGLKSDLYVLHYENKTAHYRGITGIEQRDTVGIRLFGAAGGFDWDNEAAYQTGSFRGHDIRAGMLAASVGYTFATVPWQPRIGLDSNFASGDNTHSSTIGTFNAMYPRLPYFAETSLLVPANIYDVQPTLIFHPVPAVLAKLGWDTLWRVSTTDGLYGSGMSEYANTNKVTGSRIGTELYANVRWRLDRHLQLGAIAATFLAGPAVQEALGKQVWFFVLFATYRF